MWSDVIRNLVAYRQYMVLAGLGTVVLTVVGMLALSLLQWKSATMKIYGVFVDMKPFKLVALSLLLARLLFFWFILFFGTELKITYLCYGGLITLVLLVLLSDWKLTIIDLLFTAVIFGGLYSNYLLRGYLVTVQRNAGILLMAVTVMIFVFAASCYGTLQCIRTLVMSGNTGVKSKRSGYLLHQGALLIAGAVIAISPYYFISRIDTLTIKENMYQYITEERTDYFGESRITKSGINSVIQNNGQIVQLPDTPLYFEKKDKILLPSVISIVMPKLSLTYRVSNMSRIYEADNGYYVENEKSTIPVSDFFLFDGKDCYIFFEPIAITWEKQSVTISPFSFVKVKYNQSITIFDHEKQKYYTIDTGTCSVTAKMKCRAVINLSTDIMSTENSQEQMLFLQPNLLEDLQ